MFPSYVHSVFESPTHTWPIRGQGYNECNFYALCNALNTLEHRLNYNPEQLKRRVGPLFHARLGGTFPFLKSWLLKRDGFGSHFGNLRYTNAEYVLRQLIDMHIPVLVDIYTAAQIGFTRIYGQHAVVLVGYSDPYVDSKGVLREEYYLVDSEWPRLGEFTTEYNNIDRDGDGIAEDYPGNRTISRNQFMRVFTTRCYTPIFRNLLNHQQWYHATFRPHHPSLVEQYITGSNDQLKFIQNSDVIKL
ncbi:MAG: hypothetical protein RI985_1377 [Chloroflexota bacterium]